MLSPVEFNPHNRQCVWYTITSMAFIATHSGQGIINAAINQPLITYYRNLKKHQNKFQMKTTIISSLAVCAMVSLLACGSPSGDTTNTDSTGAIRSEPN